jgi:hypothetical protein
VKISLKLAILVAAMAFGSTGSGHAQQASNACGTDYGDTDFVSGRRRARKHPHPARLGRAMHQHQPQCAA